MIKSGGKVAVVDAEESRDGGCRLGSDETASGVRLAGSVVPAR